MHRRHIASASTTMVMLLLLSPACSQGHDVHCTCWVVGDDGSKQDVLFSDQGFCAGSAEEQEATLEEHAAGCSDSGEECSCACDDHGGRCFSR